MSPRGASATQSILHFDDLLMKAVNMQIRGCQRPFLNVFPPPTLSAIHYLGNHQV